MAAAAMNDGGQDPIATVLVVEDEVLIRLATAEYLRECGYRVVEVASGDEAQAVLQAGLAVDVVFTDVMMPGAFNGFALARWVRDTHPEIRVILTSGVQRTAQDAQDLCESKEDFMDKPYVHSEVADRIKALLARATRG